MLLFAIISIAAFIGAVFSCPTIKKENIKFHTMLWMVFTILGGSTLALMIYTALKTEFQTLQFIIIMFGMSVGMFMGMSFIVSMMYLDYQEREEKDKQLKEKTNK